MPGDAPQHLIACLFDGENKAEEARAAIEKLNQQLSILKLGNVAVIHKTADGQVAISETGDVRNEWGAWSLGTGTAAAVAVALTGGVILVPALLAGGVAAVATQFIDTGFPDPVLKQIGEGLNAGQSVLITLVHSQQERDIVETELHSLGGQFIQSTLSEETVRKLGASAAAATATALKVEADEPREAPDSLSSPGDTASVPQGSKIERAPTGNEGLPRAPVTRPTVPTTPSEERIMGSPGSATFAQLGAMTPEDLARTYSGENPATGQPIPLSNEGEGRAPMDIDESEDEAGRTQSPD